MCHILQLWFITESESWRAGLVLTGTEKLLDACPSLWSDAALHYLHHKAFPHSKLPLWGNVWLWQPDRDAVSTTERMANQTVAVDLMRSIVFARGRRLL